MNADELGQAVLRFVGRPRYKPVKPRVIADELGLDDTGRRDLKKVIKKLVKQGQLAWAPNHQVTRPGSTSTDRVTGIFRRTRGGFGFVRPTGNEQTSTRDADVYIAAKNTRDAADGDLVLVKLLSRSHRGKNVEGVILDVVERETRQFVGTYFTAAGSSYVRVDGDIFQHPIAVGDPGAKGAREDDKVVFEMVRFPSHVHDGEGVITEVLGPRGKPGVDTLSIIREFNLPEDFAEDALEESRAQAAAFDESIAANRRDLTGETVITIDPVDARDFDDAISLKRLDNGHWQLGVHIADVSHFVVEGTALDREAHERSTSVYLPDRVLPMLPEIISNSLASLQPDRTRYTKTAWIEFTADGARVATDLDSTAIKSKRRFTYEEVDDYLAQPRAWKKKLAADVHRLLGDMYNLAMILRARRLGRGALELSLSEVHIDLDKDGHVIGAHQEEHTESHQIIEEFMLAANEAVAETFAAAEFDFLRRLHYAPDPRKLKALAQFVRELGFEVDSLESRFEIQSLLNSVAGQPEEAAVNYAVLRSMQRAVYGPEDEGHYALASNCYCHFTSPIRRYPDLTIHRLIDCLLANKKPAQHFQDLVILGAHCSRLEQRAEDAERELIKVKLLNYLADRIGEEFEAVVTGVMEFGLFARGLDLPAEGLIHVSALTDDYYHYDQPTHTLSGHRRGNSYRLGDPIRVAVVRVDVDRRELDFRVVARRERAMDVKRDKQRVGTKGTPRSRTSPRDTETGSKSRQKKKQQSPGRGTSQRKKKKAAATGAGRRKKKKKSTTQKSARKKKKATKKSRRRK